MCLRRHPHVTRLLISRKRMTPSRRLVKQIAPTLYQARTVLTVVQHVAVTKYPAIAPGFVFMIRPKVDALYDLPELIPKIKSVSEISLQGLIRVFSAFVPVFFTEIVWFSVISRGIQHSLLQREVSANTGARLLPSATQQITPPGLRLPEGVASQIVLV